jgi:hypothetical protein
VIWNVGVAGGRCFQNIHSKEVKGIKLETKGLERSVRQRQDADSSAALRNGKKLGSVDLDFIVVNWRG